MGLRGVCLTSSGMYVFMDDFYNLLYSSLRVSSLVGSLHTTCNHSHDYILDCYFAVNDVMYITVLTKFIYIYTHT